MFDVTQCVCVCVCADLHATGRRKTQCCLLEEGQQWQESHHYAFLKVSESRSSGSAGAVDEKRMRGTCFDQENVYRAEEMPAHTTEL